jgi:hypothetical protein
MGADAAELRALFAVRRRLARGWLWCLEGLLVFVCLGQELFDLLFELVEVVLERSRSSFPSRQVFESLGRVSCERPVCYLNTRTCAKSGSW